MLIHKNALTGKYLCLRCGTAFGDEDVDWLAG